MTALLPNINKISMSTLIISGGCGVSNRRWIALVNQIQ